MDYKLSPYRSQGAGYALLWCSDLPSVVSSCAVKISRLGVQQSNLGPGGWQISEHRWTLDVILAENGPSIVLTPAIVQHMVASTNYSFLIETTQGQRTIIVPWKGVPSYRPGDPRSTDFVTPPPFERHETQPSKSIESILESSALHEIFAAPEQMAPTQGDSSSVITQSVPAIRKRCSNLQCGGEVLSNMSSCPWCGTVLRFND